LTGYCSPAQSLRRFLALLVLLLVQPVSGQSADTSTAHGELAGITAQRVVTVAAGGATENLPLLEFVDTGGGSTARLSLVWRLERTMWFPTWNIVLEVAGVLPETGEPFQESVLLGTDRPEPGRSYEVALSYEYGTGAVAASLYDLSAGKYLRKYEGSVRPLPGPLRARPDDASAAIPYYVPVGVSWETMVGDEARRTVSRLAESPDDPVWLRIVSSRPARGEFWMTLRHGDGESDFRLGAAGPGETVYPVPNAALRPGTSHVSLRYIVDGEVVWNSRPLDFTVGKVSGTVRQANVSDDKSGVTVVLALEGTASLQGVEFSLAAAVEAMTWDDRRGGYQRQAVTEHLLQLEDAAPATDSQRVVAATIPLPAESGAFNIVLDLRTNPSIATEMARREITVSTVTGTVLGEQSAAGGVRICSYNILGFEGFTRGSVVTSLGAMDDPRRIDHFVRVIRELNCDILGIQEGHSVEMLKRIAQSVGTNLAAFPSATRFPGGILTRYGVQEIRVFNHAGPANQNAPFSRFAGAALLSIKGTDVWVVNFHAWPHDEAMRLREAEILGRQLEKLMQSSPHVIVMGDFNSTIGGPFDRVLRSLGLVNAMGLEWIGYRPTTVDRTVIDHIYVTRDLAERISSGRVHQGLGFDEPHVAGDAMWYNSDHYPVVVEVLWP